MSFLSGFMGNKVADSFIDQAVDKAGEFLLFKKLDYNHILHWNDAYR